MAPKKLSLVTLVSMIISAFFMFILLVLSIDAETIFGMYLFMISVLGFMLVLIASFLLRKANKSGYYMYLGGWFLILANINLIPIMLSYIWMIYSLILIRNDEETRIYLKLENNFFEKSFNKKNKSSVSIKPNTNQEIEQKIIEYIKSTEQQGYSDEQIIQVLEKSGYSKEMVEDALKQIKANENAQRQTSPK